MTWSVDFCPDSFEFLRSLGDREVDVVYTDPPYSPHVQGNLCSGSLVGTKAVPKYELPFPALASYAFLGDCIRAAKRWVVSYCDLEAFGKIETVFPDNYVRGCVWHKPNSMGQLTRDRPATAFEGVALLHRADEKKRWNGKGGYAIWECDYDAGWRCNGTRGEKDRHPNQKPLNLCLKHVALFTERGETVLDPFAGSGRIGEACVMLGRNYIGLDWTQEWVDKARLRIADAESKPVTDEYALSLCTMPKTKAIAVAA